MVLDCEFKQHLIFEFGIQVTFTVLYSLISLAGIVVNNAVVLIDYTDLLFKRKKIDLNLSKNELIDKSSALELVKMAGKARLKPVLLTAITTIFGLVPLAVGLNIDFFSQVDAQPLRDLTPDCSCTSERG